MNHESILKQLDAERLYLRRDGEISETEQNVRRVQCGDPPMHWIQFASLTASSVENAIDAQLRHYGELRAEFEWKVYSHDQPSDLLDRLRRRNFSIGAQEAVLVLDLEHRPGWIDAVNPQHQVIRVEQTEQVKTFCEAAAEIFGKDYSFTGRELAEAIRTGSTQHRGYMAMVNGKAVSVGRLYTHPGSAFGGLYGGGTLSDYRGRGLYRAVVAVRARDALNLGARYLIVDALPTSRPILTRLGFEHLTDTWPCTWSPQNA